GSPLGRGRPSAAFLSVRKPGRPGQTVYGDCNCDCRRPIRSRRTPGPDSYGATREGGCSRPRSGGGRRRTAAGARPEPEGGCGEGRAQDVVGEALVHRVAL